MKECHAQWVMKVSLDMAGNLHFPIVWKDENKINALKILMRHYHEEDFKFNEKVAMMTEVFRVKVLDMTGKRRDNIHPEEKVKRHITLE